MIGFSNNTKIVATFVPNKQSKIHILFKSTEWLVSAVIALYSELVGLKISLECMYINLATFALHEVYQVLQTIRELQ